MRPDQLLDCQNEYPPEPVDPDNERVTFWVDEYGEPHLRVRRWHPVRAWVLALLESILLLVVMGAVILGVPVLATLVRRFFVESL